MEETAVPTDEAPASGLSNYQTLARAKFYASERCEAARIMLDKLVHSTDYDTESTYYVDSLEFCERHLDYLSRHPNLELNGYMSNLRLMTRKRS